MGNIVMMLSIVPYFIFLYLIYRIWKLDPRLMGKTTLIGFFSMLGFIFVTAVAGTLAVKVFGGRTLGSVDWLHGVAESGLTVTNGLIALGLRKQLDKLELDEFDNL